MTDEHASPGTAPIPLQNCPAPPAEYWVKPTRPHRHPFVPYRPPLIDAVEGERRGEAFCDFLETRRSVRYSSDAPVPLAMIEVAVHAANTAPSGAHLQPWTFVATSDPATKHAIRQAAEREERVFYHEREVPAWREALDRLETDEDKSYLDVVPWIVVAFAQKHTPLPDGTLRKNYYVTRASASLAGSSSPPCTPWVYPP